MFDPINLDGLTHEPAEMEEAAKVLRQLTDYAETKALAMRLRLSGDVASAVRMERALERLYGRLPEWAKW